MIDPRCNQHSKGIRRYIGLLTCIFGLLPCSAYSSKSRRADTIRRISVTDPDFGAKCDWNGRDGSDDSYAFQLAANKAGALYRSSHVPVQISVSKACVLRSTVVFGSGVHWMGGGTIIVPEQSKQILLARDADDISVQDISIKVLRTACGPNNVECSAIAWVSTTKDTLHHSQIVIRNNTIEQANWGILIAYAAGTGSLTDVTITGNTVRSRRAYSEADGIHIGGRVSNFSITDNLIENRADAGIAASSELPDYICSTGSITKNRLLQDRVGLDNSGCTHTVWQDNFVLASLPVDASNPAFRAIRYLGLPSTDVTARGNYLSNGSGFGEFAAKMDDEAVSAKANNLFSANTIAASRSLYLRGSGIRASANTFLQQGSTLTLDYNSTKQLLPAAITVGENIWVAGGQVLSGNPAFYNLHFASQRTPSPITYADPNRLAWAGHTKDLELAALGNRRIVKASMLLHRRSLARGECLQNDVNLPGVLAEQPLILQFAPRLSRQVVGWSYVPASGKAALHLCATDPVTLPATLVTLTPVPLR